MAMSNDFPVSVVSERNEPSEIEKLQEPFADESGETGKMILSLHEIRSRNAEMKQWMSEMKEMLASLLAAKGLLEIPASSQETLATRMDEQRAPPAPDPPDPHTAWSRSVSRHQIGTIPGQVRPIPPSGLTSRFSDVELPKPDGALLREWINQCEQTFFLEGTPPEMKVRRVSRHFVGQALQWHREYIRNRYDIYPSWPDYIIDISAQFSRNWDVDVVDCNRWVESSILSDEIDWNMQKVDGLKKNRVVYTPTVMRDGDKLHQEMPKQRGSVIEEQEIKQVKMKSALIVEEAHSEIAAHQVLDLMPESPIGSEIKLENSQVQVEHIKLPGFDPGGRSISGVPPFWVAAEDPRSREGGDASDKPVDSVAVSRMKDHSGLIAYKELKDGLFKLGSKFNGVEVKKLMEAADEDGDVSIAYIGFIPSMLNFDPGGKAWQRTILAGDPLIPEYSAREGIDQVQLVLGPCEGEPSLLGGDFQDLGLVFRTPAPHKVEVTHQLGGLVLHTPVAIDIRKYGFTFALENWIKDPPCKQVYVQPRHASRVSRVPLMMNTCFERFAFDPGGDRCQTLPVLGYEMKKFTGLVKCSHSCCEVIVCDPKDTVAVISLAVKSVKCHLLFVLVYELTRNNSKQQLMEKIFCTAFLLILEDKDPSRREYCDRDAMIWKASIGTLGMNIVELEKLQPQLVIMGLDKRPHPCSVMIMFDPEGLVSTLPVVLLNMLPCNELVAKSKEDIKWVQLLVFGPCQTAHNGFYVNDINTIIWEEVVTSVSSFVFDPGGQQSMLEDEVQTMGCWCYREFCY